MRSQGQRGKMPCESCGAQFTVFRRKRACSECSRLYCAVCLKLGGGLCLPCRALTTRPLAPHHIASLKVRDLRCFLQTQNVSTRGCVEKEELVQLCMSHVNGAGFRRRGGGGGAAPGPFAKINDFFIQAFDLRQNAPAPPQQRPNAHAHTDNCHNAAHTHTHSPPPPAPAYPAAPRERFTLRPGGEPEVRVEAEAGAGAGADVRSESSEGARVDTADCFEIEDLDDAGWEFVKRPAEPLPNDSEILMTERVEGGASSSERSSPESVEGRRVEPAEDERAERAENEVARETAEVERPAAEAERPVETERISTQDRPSVAESAEERGVDEAAALGEAVTLESLTSESELEALSARQLMYILARNRVEFRGCVERGELLERARRLWRERAKVPDIDALPLEECCKICMAAPLECVLLECGHMAACTACSRQLAECPFCRQYVVRAVRVFRS